MVHGPINIPIPPIVVLTEFSHANAVANAHPLPVSCYLIFSLWVYLCSWMHIMFMLWSIADAVSSSSCPALFKVLTLNVANCMVRLHFSNFCFSLSSVACFSNTGSRAPISAGHAPFITRAKSDVVWTGGLSVGHRNLSMAVFILVYRSHPYRWAAVFLDRTIWSWPWNRGIHTPRVWLGMALNRQPLAFTSTMQLPMAFEKHFFLFFYFVPFLPILSFNLVKVHSYFLFIGLLIYGSLHPYRNSILR